MIRQGGDIKIGGAPGAFDKEFTDMEDKLEQVRKIVDGANVTSDDIDDLKMKMEAIRKNLTDNNAKMDDTQADVTVSMIMIIIFIFM